jgi:D-aminopeptidase
MRRTAIISAIVINGHPVNEAELIGLTYGERGVPVIFVSGDDHLSAELRTMPWVEYVTVKKATGIATAELLPLEEVRKKLRLGAQHVIEQLPKAKLMKVSKPVATEGSNG